MAHTDMSISAMKQALQALEFAADLIAPITENCQCQICLAHTALRQAIEQAECDAEVYSVWVEMRDKEDEARIKAYMEAKMKHIKMYSKCMNLADGLDVEKFVELVRADEREACAKLADDWPDYNVQGLAEAIRARGDAIDMSQERVDETAKDRHISYVCPNCYWSLDKQVRTHTPEDVKKIESKWVGLTEEEREQVRSSAGYNQFMSAGEYAKAVQLTTEAKLREKNT